MGFDLGAAVRGITGVDISPGFQFNTNVSNGIPFVGKDAAALAKQNTSSAPANKSVLGVATSQTAAASPPASVYSGSSGGSSGSAAASAAAKQNSANLAAYQDQINSLNQLLGAADTSRAQGEASIGQSYNNNLSRLNQNQSQTLSRYATQREDTGNDYQKTLKTINSNARNGYNSLQALLGGTGSAGNVLAPFAVSQQANSQRGSSADAFAKNQRDLDTATASAQQAYQNSKDDLYNQQQDKLRELVSSINSQKQNYLSQRDSASNQLNIARGGGYVASPSGNAIQALLNEQAGLGSKYANTNFDVKEVNAATPDLAQYQAQAASLANGSNVDTGDVDPAAQLAALLKQNDDNNSSFAY